MPALVGAFMGATEKEEYWDWFAVALFLLITVDMITTMYAAWYIGPAAEANPLMRWAIHERLITVTPVNLTATIIAVLGFYILLQLLESATDPYDQYLAVGVELWLGGLVAAGLFVFCE